jgi:hypothetical protein
MSRRCKPGIRARVIKGENDLGKIVFVVRHYFGEELNGATWPTALFPWVVTSLGSPLHSYCVDTGKEAPPAMTIVLDDGDLEPLDDGDLPSDEVESSIDTTPIVRAPMRLAS